MNIQYLKKLIENKTIEGATIKGVSESSIKEIENKFDIKFPQAYKEFLFLAGDYSGRLYLLEINDLKTISSDQFQSLMQNIIKKRGLILKKKYWIFAYGENFLFFYLEDGVEDPEVFYCVETDNDDGYEIKSSHRIFSKYISDSIDYSRKVEKRKIW